MSKASNKMEENLSDKVNENEKSDEDTVKMKDGKENDDEIEGGKKDSCEEKKWTCEDTPLWRIFMKSYIDEEKRLEIADKFDRRKPTVLPKFPNVSSENGTGEAPYPCLPLNTMNLGERARLPDKLDRRQKIRLWRKMQMDPAVDTSSFQPELEPQVSLTDSQKWPGTWPCVSRDLAGEKIFLKKLERRKAKGLLPCQEDTDDEANPDVPVDDFADHRELGHARVPVTCPSVKKTHLVDRSNGERPGLVDGDYVLFHFAEGNEEPGRVYADVCLRGMKGMNLRELSDQRDRSKTWKFCFYQAIVALLAKTQLRYKFAWSVNVEYIYDHAWMLFVHMGSVNVKERIRLDDVVVYNYKYSVELELVHEMSDVPRITGVSWNYAEKDFTSVRQYERPELMKTRESIGLEKSVIEASQPVHELTRNVEKWFDQLPIIYRNCVFRTPKFSLAFWKDETFWYLYNPYRCDVFGLWDDGGYACIMKFASKISLRRHLMILLLRAYSYQPETSLKLFGDNDLENETKGSRVEDSEEAITMTGSEENRPGDFITIQIYQMIYHCVQIHNVKLLQRKPPGAKTERVRKKEFDNCGLDFFASSDPCALNVEDEDNEIEKVSWLGDIVWSRFSSSKKETVDNDDSSKLRWHQYYVEVPLKLFSLWGEIHPTGQMFPRANRGKQIRACYAVAAGMTRIQAPEYWSQKTLDAIVMCGDRYYEDGKLELKNLNRGNEIDDLIHHEHLAKTFKIGETLFEVHLPGATCGRLYDKKGRSLWKLLEQMFLTWHFGILTCECSCLGLYKYCGAYYMLDVNSVGPPLFQYGDGTAYLIRAASYHEYLKVLIRTIGSSECSRFTLHPIVIDRMIDLGTGDPRERVGRVLLKKFECPFEDDAKAMRKWRSKEDRKKPTIDRTSCKKTNCRG